MKPIIFLRIASGLMLLHTIGHSIGTVTWTKGPNQTLQAVIDAMRNHKFLFMGANRSFGDFYEGFGVTMIFVLLLLSILLWVIAAEASAYPKSAAKVLLPIGCFLVSMAITEFVYFFLFAAVITSLAALCTGMGLYSLLKKNDLHK